MPNPNAHLERSLQPRTRSTRALVASLDERHMHPWRTSTVQRNEWRELRRRIADTLQNGSPNDLAEMLDDAGMSEEPRP